MYFISEKITDLRSLTKKKIRGIVEGELGALANECGEVWPCDRAKHLAFHLPARRFAIAVDHEIGALDVIKLVTIDAGVTGDDISEECEKSGIDYSDDDFDNSEIIARLFTEKCEKKRVGIYTPNDTFEWADEWEKDILEMVRESIAESESDD